MALPELQLPAGLPCFLVRGHSATLEGRYDDIRMAAGAARRRRVYTIAPREVEVQAVYEADQAAQIDAWFEGPLQAGALHFAAHVRNQGPGMRWWDATWVEPYTMEALHEGRWRMSGRLRLYGAPSETPPERTTMRAAIRVPVDARAALTVGRTLAAAITVAVDGVGYPQDRFLAAAITVTIGEPPPEGLGRITPEGDRRFTPEGDRRVVREEPPATFARETPEGDTRVTPEGDTRIYI